MLNKLAILSSSPLGDADGPLGNKWRFQSRSKMVCIHILRDAIEIYC